MARRRAPHATIRHMPLANGSTFAGFTIVRLLGTGSISEVYLVESDRLKSRAALKILSAEVSGDSRFLTRFDREIGIAGSLRNPKIVEVYDSGTSDGRVWVLMEFVPGPDAARLVRERFPSGMPADGTSVIIADVADALDYARDQGLSHRHVTPSDILIADPYSLLTGFGVSGADGSSESDQAQLAATAVQLLTGAPRFERSLLPLGQARQELAGLDPVLAKAMSPDPRDQYATCREFAVAFARRGSEPVVAPAAEAISTATKPAQKGPGRRTTLLLTAASIVVIAAVAVAGVYFVRHRSAADVATQANESTDASTSAAPLPPPGPPACGEGEALLPQMSQRQKLAQLLMVGVTGEADARQVVLNNQVGGIMIGSWTDLTVMGEQLKAIEALGSPLPLAVSTDEEGGRVSRLKTLIGVQPSARELVASGKTVDEVFQIALDRGQKMLALGITVDFAPVADVSDQDDDTVIGDRSFSNDPQKVIEYAGAYARGLQQAGVTPVFKHFPGHGHASGDSHLGGVTTPSLDVLKKDDLVPYTVLLKEIPGAAVMVGHMQVPGLTEANGTLAQSSLSPAAYDLLRSGNYGGVPFDGVVFTDDISSMGAINQTYTVAQAALKALQAGADIALWITTDEVPGVLDALEKAVADGTLDMKKVDASVLRIAKIKGKLPACGG